MLVNRQVINGINTSFSTIFNKTFSETKTTWDKIATKVPSETGEESYKWLGSIPRMKEWIGEKEIQNFSASDYTLKNKDYDITIGVDRNDIEDDKIGIYKPVIMDMAQSAAMFPNELVFETLASGFKEKCYDGKPFFSDKHKIGDIEYSNLGTEKLSVGSYSAARAKMMSLKDENKKSLNITPDLLVVPPALESEGRKILMADLINGETNVFKGTAELLVDPSLAGNDTAWYLLSTSKPLKPLIYQERKVAKFVSLTEDTDTNVFFNKQFLYSVEARGNAGFGFWQMAFASTGKKG